MTLKESLYQASLHQLAHDRGDVLPARGHGPQSGSMLHDHAALSYSARELQRTLAGVSAEDTARVHSPAIGCFTVFEETGRAGGLARAQALTPARRSEIARQAARVRWNKE